MTDTIEEQPSIMADDIADLRRDIQQVMQGMAELKALVQSEPQRCPYRESIARIGPDEQRITKLEEQLTDARLSIVRMGLASGSTSTGVVAALFGLGKALGWW